MKSCLPFSFKSDLAEPVLKLAGEPGRASGITSRGRRWKFSSSCLPWSEHCPLYQGGWSALPDKRLSSADIKERSLGKIKS